MDVESTLPADDVCVSGRQVRSMCGGWSPMTLSRYQHSAAYSHFNFPAPVAQINRRWFWRLIDIRAWLKLQAPKDRLAAKQFEDGVADRNGATAPGSEAAAA